MRRKKYEFWPIVELKTDGPYQAIPVQNKLHEQCPHDPCQVTEPLGDIHPVLGEKYIDFFCMYIRGKRMQTVPPKIFNALLCFHYH